MKNIHMIRLSIIILSFILFALFIFYCNKTISNPVIPVINLNQQQSTNIQSKLDEQGRMISDFKETDQQVIYQELKLFQQKYHLLADGLLGPATLKHFGLPIEPTTALYQFDQKFIEEFLFSHFSQDSLELQVAIAAVLINRVEHHSFPDQLDLAIQQLKHQFTAKQEFSSKNSFLGSTVQQATQLALDGIDPTHGALYFFHQSSIEPEQLEQQAMVYKIDNYIFSLEDRK